jgi:hypothetical protein
LRDERIAAAANSLYSSQGIGLTTFNFLACVARYGGVNAYHDLFYILLMTAVQYANKIVRISTSSVFRKLGTLSPLMPILEYKDGNNSKTHTQHTKARESPSVSKLNIQRTSRERQEGTC